MLLHGVPVISRSRLLIYELDCILRLQSAQLVRLVACALALLSLRLIELLDAALHNICIKIWISIELHISGGQLELLRLCECECEES